MLWKNNYQCLVRDVEMGYDPVKTRLSPIGQKCSQHFYFIAPLFHTKPKVARRVIILQGFLEKADVDIIDKD